MQSNWLALPEDIGHTIRRLQFRERCQSFRQQFDCLPKPYKFNDLFSAVKMSTTEGQIYYYLVYKGGSKQVHLAYNKGISDVWLMNEDGTYECDPDPWPVASLRPLQQIPLA